MAYSLQFPNALIFKNVVNALRDIIKDGIFFLEEDG
jgi:hypothetical protein